MALQLCKIQLSLLHKFDLQRAHEPEIGNISSVFFVVVVVVVAPHRIQNKV